MSPPIVPESVLRQIEQHTKSVTDREVGGILVGTLGGDTAEETEIVGAVPALKAVAAAANVTFTHEVWDEALRVVDQDFPGRKIVGWYHSHPDFGVFLSEYDLFIHRNFFSLPGMMALVVDPVRGDAGWFTIVNGDVSRVGGYSVEPVRHAAEVEAQQTAARQRSYGWVLIGAAALLVAFVVGWVAAPRGSTTPDESELAAAERSATQSEHRVRELESQLADARRTPVTPPSTFQPGSAWPPAGQVGQGGDVGETGSGPAARRVAVQTVYVVQPGDSLWKIAARFYGDGERYPEIVAANQLGDGGNIDPGDELVIPDSGGGPGRFEVRISDG